MQTHLGKLFIATVAILYSTFFHIAGASQHFGASPLLSPRDQKCSGLSLLNPSFLSKITDHLKQTEESASVALTSSVALAASPKLEAACGRGASAAEVANIAVQINSALLRTTGSELLLRLCL